MRAPFTILICAALATSAVRDAAAADGDDAPAADGDDAPAADGDDAPLPPHKVGPQVVDLGNGLEIDLPAGLLLLERAEARADVEARGDNPAGTLAIILSPDAAWELDIDLVEDGHVSDADADKLDAGELLRSMTRGTAEQNQVRARKGVPAITVVGWSKPPAYDRTRRVLTWAVDLSAEQRPFLNDVTNVLGRGGYAMVTLIATSDGLAEARAGAAAALRGVRWQRGHRYEDFDPDVDKDSGLGLRELVAGGGAIALGSKLGLFAKIALIFKKAFIFIAAAVAGFFKWLARRGKRSAAAGEPSAPPGA